MEVHGIGGGSAQSIWLGMIGQFMGITWSVTLVATWRAESAGGRDEQCPRLAGLLQQAQGGNGGEQIACSRVREDHPVVEVAWRTAAGALGRGMVSIAVPSASRWSVIGRGRGGRLGGGGDPGRFGGSVPREERSSRVVIEDWPSSRVVHGQVRAQASGVFVS